MDSNDISWKIIDKMFKDNPNMIVKHHIDSYNQFFSTGLRDVFKNLLNTSFFFKRRAEGSSSFENQNYSLILSYHIHLRYLVSTP